MKWFVIVLIGGLGIFFYTYNHRSDAYKFYIRFDRARLSGQCGELKSLVSGAAAEWADAYCAGGGGGDTLAGLAALANGGPDAAYGDAASAGGLATLQDAAGISLVHRRVSETENADYTVTIVASVIPVDRNNDPGNKKFMPSKHRCTVTLTPKGDTFVITEFSDSVVKD